MANVRRYFYARSHLTSTVVPFDLERHQSLLRGPHVIGDNRDGVIKTNDLARPLTLTVITASLDEFSLRHGKIRRKVCHDTFRRHRHVSVGRGSHLRKCQTTRSTRGQT